MARKEKKYHYIYKTTCSVTNKYYIGMHSTDKLDDGYIGSGKRLWFSIKYHGKKNHTKEILEYCNTREELRNREREIVNEQLLQEDLCLNLVVGGDGGGKIWSEEHMVAFSKAGNDKFKWLLENDVEFKEYFTEKMRKITSERTKRGDNDKFIKSSFDWTGKNHSDETKKKMSETKKGKGTGKSNSQFGTCWITNGEINKKVNKEELETYLHNGEGWRSGRVLTKKQTEKVNKVAETKRKVKRPPYEQLLEEVEELGYTGTGSKYGVTRNAIKKWVVHYEKYV